VNRRHRKPPAAPEEPNELREWREWSDQQYNPGYWTGGRVPPFFKRRRPGAYGYVHIVGGILGLILFGAMPIAAYVYNGRLEVGHLLVLPFLALSGVELVAGVRLVRGPHRIPGRDR
jgi:hypothetical protein